MCSVLVLISVSFDVVRKRSSPHHGVVYLMPPSSVDRVQVTPSSLLGPMRTSSSRSRDSNATTPSMDMDEGDALFPGGSQASEDDKESSLSAPSSPKMRRSLHRRQRSQSLDDITIENFSSLNPSKLLSPGRGPSIRIRSPSRDETKGIVSPLLKAIGSDESDSEFDYETIESRGHSSGDSFVHVSEDPKESDEEEGGGGGGGKLSKLKGRLLMKVKSSRNSFLPRPRSRSPQPAGETTVSTGGSSPKKNLSPVDSSNYKGDHTVTSSSGSGTQRVGAVKQHFRVSSPSLWRKMRGMSPSGTPGPVSVEKDISKLEEARKKSRSRLIFI